MKYHVVSHEHIFEPGAFFPQCHASTLAFAPGGALVAAWFAGLREGEPDVEIWAARRENGQWSQPACVTSHPGEPCWNPVLHRDGDRLLLFYKVGQEIPAWRTMVQESADGGRSWGPARELVAGDRGGRGPVKNKCLALAGGALLAPASVETQDAWRCFADRSDDGGKTWRRSADVPVDTTGFSGPGVIQPALWQDGAGRVHMLMRSSEGAVYGSVSADGGMTWAQAWRTRLPNNNSGLDAVRLDDGRVVAVFNPVGENWGARSPIAFAVSRDNGKTWSEAQVLDHVPSTRNVPRAEFSYPAVIAQGRDVYISYTWKRRTIACWHLRLAQEKKREDGICDGQWVTMVTPFTPQGAVDYTALGALVDWYIEKGVDGLFAVCQSSEMFCLSQEERAAIARFVLERAAGRVPVVASGHISDGLEQQIEELRAMAQTGVAAVVLVSNRLAAEGESEEVWKRNARRILDALPGCRFGIYECPYPYKRLLSPELLRWCADTGRFVFLKDTSCDMDMIRRKLDAVKGTGLRLFNANSATLVASLRAGASGFCGVMANFHPELYRWILENWENEPYETQRAQAFATAASLAELQMYPVNAKYHLALRGVPMGVHSRSVDAGGWNRLRAIEAQALLELWEDFAVTLCPPLG